VTRKKSGRMPSLEKKEMAKFRLKKVDIRQTDEIEMKNSIKIFISDF